MKSDFYKPVLMVNETDMMHDIFDQPKPNATTAFKNLFNLKNGLFSKVSIMFCQQLYHEENHQLQSTL